MAVCSVKRKEAVSSLRERPDSYLVPPVPVRGGERPVEQTNLAAHVISEFGLQVSEDRRHRDPSFLLPRSIKEGSEVQTSYNIGVPVFIQPQ